MTDTYVQTADLSHAHTHTHTHTPCLFIETTSKHSIRKQYIRPRRSTYLPSVLVHKRNSDSVAVRLFQHAVAWTDRNQPAWLAVISPSPEISRHAHAVCRGRYTCCWNYVATRSWWPCEPDVWRPELREPFVLTCNLFGSRTTIPGQHLWSLSDQLTSS